MGYIGRHRDPAGRRGEHGYKGTHRAAQAKWWGRTWVGARHVTPAPDMPGQGLSEIA